MRGWDNGSRDATKEQDRRGTGVVFGNESERLAAVVAAAKERPARSVG